MPRPDLARAALLLALALPALALAAWQAAWSLPFLSDDALISLRYAERLLAGDGLTWTDGERVEGYSNLLWVLACAGLGALGIDLVTAARLLGAACTAIALPLLAGALPMRDFRAVAAAAGAPLLVAATAPVMAWTLGGLEGPLVLLLLTWGFARLARDVTGDARAGDDRGGDDRFGDARAGDSRASNAAGALRAANALPFALLCWTRPDGPLWAAAAGLALWPFARREVGGSRATAALVLFAAPPLAAVAAQLGFRLAYHGDWVPNTAHVKAKLGGEALAAGLHYVGHGAFVLLGLVLPAALGAALGLAQRATRPIAAAAIASVLAFLAYVASIGGEHFPGFRLLHGVLAPLGLLALLGLRASGAVLPLRAQRTSITIGAILAIALAGTALSVCLSRIDNRSSYVRSEVWEWYGKRIGVLLREAFGDEAPRIAVDAAGAVPFWSRLPALDMLGLCDRTIATSPPPPFAAQVAAAHGFGVLAGHMLGNGDHVMDAAPDLMLFHRPPGLPLGVFASALEFEDDPRFLQGYRCVRIEVPAVDAAAAGVPPAGAVPLRIPLWVRLDGRVGVQRSAGEVVVPAWLLGSYRQPYAFRFAYDPVPRTDPRFAQWDRDLRAAWDWFMGPGDAVAVAGDAGGLQLALRAATTAELTLPLPDGEWRARAEPASAPVDVELSRDAGHPDTATLRVAPQPGAALPLRVAAIVLTRAE